ncbi:MAG: thiol-disulfide oxidoreductase [Firmicutes bacterium]|nr:thiol-disulfide oxidoreductase [Bacillota bacterium]
MQKIIMLLAKSSSRIQTVCKNEILRELSQYAVLYVLVLCLLLYFTFTSIAREASSDSFAKTDAAYAADFTLKDLTGKEVKLNDYKGRTIFLIFMTTWCRDCLSSIPHLKAIYNRYHEKGLVMMNINVQEPDEKVTAYSKKHNLPYPTLLDSEGIISKRYGVGGVPVKLLIGRDGRIMCWNCRSLEGLIEKQFETMAK